MVFGVRKLCHDDAKLSGGVCWPHASAPGLLAYADA